MNKGAALFVGFLLCVAACGVCVVQFRLRHPTDAPAVAGPAAPANPPVILDDGTPEKKRAIREKVMSAASKAMASKQYEQAVIVLQGDSLPGGRLPAWLSDDKEYKRLLAQATKRADAKDAIARATEGRDERRSYASSLRVCAAPPVLDRRQP